MFKKLPNIKAFTLVEMLIVIVIIGILIAALMPRLQGAQGRARDVARQADLAQIQTAIINYQTQRGYYPKPGDNDTWNSNGSNDATGASLLTTKLTGLWGLSGVPKDPNWGNTVTWLWEENTTITDGDYAYMVTKKNTINNNGFILMARVETEGGANWVVNNSGTKNLSNGWITPWTDLKDIQICNVFSSDTATTIVTNSGTCAYNNIWQLRYILMF